MAKVSVYNMKGDEVGNIELNDEIFGADVNEHLIYMAVKQQLANRRQGTQKAKTRSEVSGGGRKPWRQKGTGHARQGSTRSPQWTDKVQKGSIIVLDELKMEEKKTKVFAEVMKNIKAEGKSYVVIGDNDQNVILSARNLPGVKTSVSDLINVYDIMNAKTLVVTKEAVAKIEEVFI